ncbi:hypothetical protein QTN94_13285 [Vibrio sp. M250220]|uniref:hypothetical protein n=1 Tax=Vibrio sp. M250220 TaxID=3020894 RepID=UPI002F3FC79C
MLAAIEAYKQKLAEKGDVDSLTAKLEASQQQLHHMTKEKDFVEKKYLELVQESQTKNQ